MKNYKVYNFIAKQDTDYEPWLEDGFKKLTADLREFMNEHEHATIISFSHDVLYFSRGGAILTSCMIIEEEEE